MCRFIFKRAQLTRLINTFTLAVKTFSTVIKVRWIRFFVKFRRSSAKRWSPIIIIITSDNNCLYVANVAKFELICRRLSARKKIKNSKFLSLLHHYICRRKLSSILQITFNCILYILWIKLISFIVVLKEIKKRNGISLCCNQAWF